MQTFAVGVLKEAKSIKVKCLGIDCEANHETIDCKDVLFLMEGMDLEEARESEALAACLADGRVAAVKNRAFPTMLGIWWEAVCDN